MVTKLSVGELTRGAYVENPTGFWGPTSGHTPDATVTGLFGPGTLTEDTISGVWLLPEITVSGVFDTENIISWDASFDSSSLSVFDTSKSIPTVQISVLGGVETLALKNQQAVFHTGRGTFWGDITDVSLDNDREASLTLQSFLGVLNQTVDFKPIVDRPFITALGLRLRQAGLDAQLRVSPAGLRHANTSWLGYQGNGWDWLQFICASYNLEIRAGEYDGEPTVIVEQRTYEFGGETIPNVANVYMVEKISSSTRFEQPTAGDVANVRYSWAEPITAFFTEVYPAYREDATGDPQILSVEAGETVVFELNVNAHLTKIHQPSYWDWVPDQDFSGSRGVYTVCGADKLPIKGAEWFDKGGSLTVRPGSRYGVVEVVLTGMEDAYKGPFSVAMSSGEVYNALHITGDGLVFHPVDRDWVVRPSSTEGDTGSVQDVTEQKHVSEHFGFNAVARGLHNTIDNPVKTVELTQLFPLWTPVYNDVTQAWGVPGALMVDNTQAWRVDSVRVNETSYTLNLTRYAPASTLTAYYDKMGLNTLGDLTDKNPASRMVERTIQPLE